MASRLFALDGAEVAEVDEEPGGGRTVWLVTADPAARVCPGCGTASEHVREQAVTRPADIGYGRGQVSVVWVKRRWECRVASCPRGTFTGSLPAVPPWCRGDLRVAQVDDHVAQEGNRGDLIIEGPWSGPPRVKQDAEHHPAVPGRPADQIHAWQVGGERGQVAAGARCVRPVQPLAEFLERQPAFADSVVQLGDDGLPLTV